VKNGKSNDTGEALAPLVGSGGGEHCGSSKSKLREGKKEKKKGLISVQKLHVWAFLH